MLPTSPGFSEPRAEPGHLPVEPFDIEPRPVFAIADAIEADLDLALHHVRDHRHDLRRHLLAARKGEGCLLEARRYGQPPHMAGPEFLCAMLHRPPPVASGVVPVRFCHSYNDRHTISTAHGEPG
jgi:hypothetical protein